MSVKTVHVTTMASGASIKFSTLCCMPLCEYEIQPSWDIGLCCQLQRREHLPWPDILLRCA